MIMITTDESGLSACLHVMAFDVHQSVRVKSNNIIYILDINIIRIVMSMLSRHPCLTLCDPVDCSCQAPLSMGFSRQEHWRGLPCLPPGDVPHPGIEPRSLSSPALASGFFTTSNIVIIIL